MFTKKIKKFPAPEVQEVSTDAQEAQQLAKADLNFLGMLAAPEEFTLSFPAFYITVFSILTAFKSKLERFALGFPRGFAKTTFIKLLCLWYILFSHKQFILIVGAAEEPQQLTRWRISRFALQPQQQRTRLATGSRT